jgi:hypothetical protein
MCGSRKTPVLAETQTMEVAVMKTIPLILLLLTTSSAMAGERAWVNFYTGGLIDSTYLWTWGFAEEPKSVDGTGFTPGTAAVEVKWKKSDTFDYSTWPSYGVYFGDIHFSMADMVPDSVYFKLRAPDGVGDSDRLNVWLYDPRNQNWDNAYFFELENLQILKDRNWHQFRVGLGDFQPNVGEIDVADVMAVSIERPAADENTGLPLMYIDHVWVGFPDFASGVEEKKSAAANTFSLERNYPNPFNPVTTIAFKLGTTTTVTLSVFNLRGEKIAELESGRLLAGPHTIQWNAGRLPSGAYFYRLVTEYFVQTRKMTILK